MKNKFVNFEALRQMRLNAKLNQEDAAKFIGISKQNFSKKERGEVPLSVVECAILFKNYKRLLPKTEYYDLFESFHGEYFRYDDVGVNIARYENYFHELLDQLDKTGYSLLEKWITEYAKNPLEATIKEIYRTSKGHEIPPEKLNMVTDLINSDITINNDSTKFIEKLIEIID